MSLLLTRNKFYVFPPQTVNGLPNRNHFFLHNRAPATLKILRKILTELFKAGLFSAWCPLKGQTYLNQSAA